MAAAIKAVIYAYGIFDASVWAVVESSDYPTLTGLNNACKLFRLCRHGELELSPIFFEKDIKLRMKGKEDRRV